MVYIAKRMLIGPLIICKNYRDIEFYKIYYSIDHVNTCFNKFSFFSIELFTFFAFSYEIYN
jgi:hypothetical protein